MVRTFLPSMRALVAHELRKREISQGHIANLLGVTQASISQYLSRNTRNFKAKLASLGVSEAEAERFSSLICEDIFRSRVEGVFTFYSIWKNLLASGSVCPAHRKMDPYLEGCDACMRIFGNPRMDTPRSEVLYDIEAAIRMMEMSDSFPSIMPEVSVNVVMAVSNPEDERDVAGVPGRIVEVSGRAKASMKPDFGVSRHMSQVLLAAMRYDKNIRAALNIKYDSIIERVLKAKGMEIPYTPLRKPVSVENSDVVLLVIRSTLEKLGRTPKIIVDRGGSGLEPITYIFGSSATGITRTALEIAAGYVKLWREASKLVA